MTSSAGVLAAPVPRTAFCLCGGGITGAMYEVGCLAALEDAIEGFSACDFQLFVGTSSGSTVATALAGGLNATRLYRAMLDPADDMFPLQRHHLLRFDSKEWRRVLGSGFRALRHLVSSVSSKPLELDVWTELERFTDSLPAGVFNLDAYEKFLIDFMRRRNIPATFARMPRELLLVAHDLDAGERAVFGAGELKGVPVARAAVASSAFPLLFAPVRIDQRDYVDGGLGEVGHVDLAAERGCDLIVVINPMVPITTNVGHRDVPTGHGKGKRVRDKGLLWVFNQSFRLRTHGRFSKLFEGFRAANPTARVVLLQPAQDDAVMFMHSPMNFAARRVILEYGYKSTKQLLKAEQSPLRVGLEGKGLTFKVAENS